jgi:hypothetical protein
VSVIPTLPPTQADYTSAQPASDVERIRRRLERYYADSFVPCFVPRGGRCGDVLVKLSNRDYDVGWIPWELLPLPCPTGLDGGLPDTVFDHGTDGGHPDTVFGPGDFHDGGGPSDD